MAAHIEGALYHERMGRDGPVMAFVHPNPMDQSCWLFRNEETAFGDEAREAARGVRTSAKTEDEQLVAIIVFIDEPFKSRDDFIVEPMAEHAATKPVAELCPDACAVIHGLRKPVGAPRSTQGFQAPYVGVVVDGIPGTVEKERKALLR